MNKLSHATAFTYKNIAKPLLFTLPPDGVHRSLIATGSVIQRSSLLRSALHGAWAAKPNERLRQTVHGITFANPVGLSAGFDKNIELAPLIKAVGFGFMEGGTITRLPYAGNERPWFYRLPKTKSLVVHVGLANQGACTILRRVAHYPRDTFTNFPLNISVGVTNGVHGATVASMVGDCAQTVAAVQQNGHASLVTINISCPNIYAGQAFTHPTNLELLLARIDSLNLTLPVFLKMPADLDLDAFDALLRVAARHSVAGITVANLTKNRSHLADELPAHVHGGLSGKPTFALSNKLIKHTYRTYGDRFTIIGVGGIFSAKDAYEKIKCGATLVALITGMIFEGPQLIGRINRELAELLAADGFASIQEAVGSGVK